MRFPRSSQALRWSLCFVISALVFAGPRISAGQTPPIFRGSTDIIAVDVQVIGRDGQPVRDLSADRFTVTINGRRRRVISATLVDSSASLQPAALPAATALPGKNITAGPSPPVARARIVILAIDCMTLDVAAAREAANAARRFIDESPADDLIGLFSFPLGPRVDPTADRAALEKALDDIVGQRDSVNTSSFTLRPSDVVDLAACIMEYRRIPRCASLPGGRQVELEVRLRVLDTEGRATATLGQLEDLFVGLGDVPGRKTLVLVSGGQFSSDIGGRPNLDDLGTHIARAAAQANVAIYTLFLDRSASSPFQAQTGRPMSNLENLSRDSAVMGRWLDRFTALAGGTLVKAVGGDGTLEFGRILKEMSAYYLLAVEPADADRDGRLHQIQVKVEGRGLTVRGRSWVVVPTTGAGAGALTPANAMDAAVAPVTAPPPRPLPASVHGLAEAFARKDFAAFEAALSKTDDLANVIRDLRTANGAWPGAPRRSAVFALEVALAGLFDANGFAHDEGLKLLAQTHAGVRQPGETGDEFECTWYWTEAAAIEGLQHPEVGLLFVPRARERCPSHARLALAHAVMTEQQWRRSADSRIRSEVVTRYDEAMQLPDAAPEARIRLAWFAARTGDAERALALLGTAPSTSPDRQVRYLHDLIRGRVLQSAGRLEEAATAFRQALVAWPEAQSARVGLIAAALGLGNGREAAGLADDILNAGTDQADPWWTYGRGDFRSYPTILAALRELGQ